jgi:hypothetical protein
VEIAVASASQGSSLELRSQRIRSNNDAVVWLLVRNDTKNARESWREAIPTMEKEKERRRPKRKRRRRAQHELLLPSWRTSELCTLHASRLVSEQFCQLGLRVHRLHEAIILRQV